MSSNNCMLGKGVAGGSGVVQGVKAGMGVVGGAPLKVPVAPHVRQMQIQQQLALNPRKGPKVTQLAQVSVVSMLGKGLAGDSGGV